MKYSENDIIGAVGANAFSAGKAYHRQGRVVAFEWGDDGDITSRVRGSSPKPYRQRIFIATNSKGRLVIEGNCSCPVAFNCKHVAASLLHGLGVAEPASFRAPEPMDNSVAPGTQVQTPLSLSTPVADWLNRLRQADAKSLRGEAHLPQRLIYILSPERLMGILCPIVHAFTRRLFDSRYDLAFAAS